MSNDDYESDSVDVPSAINTERAVLGFCLQPGGQASQCWQHIVDASRLKDPIDLFFDSSNKAIARAINALHEREEAITEDLVSDMVRNKGYYTLGEDDQSPSEYIYSLVVQTSINTLVDLDKSVGILRDYQERRVLISVLEGVIDDTYDDSFPLMNIADELKNACNSALAGTTRKVPTFEDIFEDQMEGISTSYVVPTGLPSLDKAFGGATDEHSDSDYLSGGWESGRTYTIAASSGVGKTSTMFRCAREAAESGAVPIILSLESDKNDVLGKLICGCSQAQWSQVRKSLIMQDRTFSCVDEEDRDSVLEAVELYRKRFRLLFQSDITNGIFDIPSIVMNVKEEEGEDAKIVVFIDYLQLLVENTRNEREEITDMTRDLHNMAQSLDIPIVMLSQVKRLDRGCRPTKNDLHGSSAIEKNSDGIIMMWRPGMLVNAEDAEEKDREFAGLGEDIMMIELAKNRIGQSLLVKAITDDSRCTIEEITDDMQPAGSYHYDSDDKNDSQRSHVQANVKTRRNSDSNTDGFDLSNEKSKRGRRRKTQRRRKRSQDDLDNIGMS